MERRPWYDSAEAVSLRLLQSASNRPVALATLFFVCLAWIAACGGSSYGPSQSNPAPSVASLNPSSATVGGAAFTLTVTGSSFISSSTVQWNGSTRATTYVTSTSLQAAITSADIATAGTANVTVSTPPPGGGTSSALGFSVDNPAPTATSLSPSGVIAGSPAFALTVTGTNFVSSSTVQWNGNARTTTFVSSTSLQAAITAADIATAGTANVTVITPAPGGGSSSAATFTIMPPAPTITLLTPSSAIQGGAAFVIAVAGTNFVPSSTVAWNGNTRPTTFVSGNSLTVNINAADIATVGAAKVTVVNPLASGGTSNPSTFFVGTTGGTNFASITVNQSAQDIVFDPVNNVFYLSVTGSASTHPNTISVLDPSTGAITSAIPAGSNPNVLAISGDSQFLYAGIDGSTSVQRFTLPSLTRDISYSLSVPSPAGGPFFALDLQVAPGSPHTTAVTIGTASSTPSAQGGVQIFDDANPRPTIAKGFGPGGGGGVLYDSLQWGSDATGLYAANYEDTGFDFYTLSVDPRGVTLAQDFQGVFGSFANRIHFDPGTKLVYADEGHVINPATGLPAGNFNASAVMVPDSTLNTAFFASHPSSSVMIQSFDQTHFIPIASITLSNVTGNPARLIRWGQNGLAFITNAGEVVLVAGDFVGPAPPLNLTPPPIPTPPPTPAPNAPVISSLLPSSAIAGAVGFTLSVAGTGFNSASIVEFNGQALATSFVSNSQLTALVPSSDVSTATTASITISNPSASGGLSAPSTFFVGTTGGSSSAGTGFAVTVFNQASKDMVFDPKNQVFYLSVPNTVANGNTISVLDPFAAKIVGEQFAGSNPAVLALSDDSQFLYAGIDGGSSVQRFTLPNLGSDVSYSLGTAGFFGPQYALDLGVAPAAPHTTAVAIGSFNVSPDAQGGIKIFDDAMPRATSTNLADFNYLRWGADGTTLFSTGELSSDLFVLAASASGAAVSHEDPLGIGDTRLHFDPGTKLVYTDTGHGVDPVAGTVVGTFNASGPMVPDSALNTAFFVSVSGTTATLQSFNLTTFALLSSMTIPNVTGNPLRLVRWAQNGLAFNTDGGQIYLIGGNFVH